MTRKRSERELEQFQEKIEHSGEELRVFVADILPHDEEVRESMEDRLVELENLVNTYGWVVIVKHIQSRQAPSYNTFIWEWRLKEIVIEMESEKANLLILWNILKPKQIYNVNKYLRDIWAKAWDRIDLILKIFEKNAFSRESKLQIELAAIKHMWPRIFGMGMELSKQWAWVWTRWKWETNTEIMKRHLRKKEFAIKKELEHFEKVRKGHRQGRIKKWLETIWVVGYTNAWKSTLTNSLTKKWVLAEDKLFATLGTSVGKMWIETDDYKWKEFLINDTIWFIRDLPPELIEAFKSTLEDSIEADLLLHVVDANDTRLDEKIKVVDDILFNIWANQKKIYVFNKIDTLPKWEFSVLVDDEEKVYKSKLNYLKEKYDFLDPIFISAYGKIWLDKLKEAIKNEFLS